MSVPTLPSTFRAWQFNATEGGLEKRLTLNPAAPMLQPKSNQHLIQVIATSLNPVDYKPAELPLVTRFLFKKPATPVIDFAGRIVQPAQDSGLEPGQLVFGASGTGGQLGKLYGGALREYTLAEPENITTLPEGVSPVAGASINIAGLTAYQTIVPYVKEGSKVFINGGSGGTGIFGIQIAKALGCHVTTTCSTANVELCKSLGADEVIDYKQQSPLQALQASGRKYDHVVDNVGVPTNLYWKSHEYTNPSAIFVAVGAILSLPFFYEATLMRLLPGFLGGGRRKLQGFVTEARPDQLSQIAQWIREGRVRPIIDSQYGFEDAPKAFEKLKTGRAKGKIIVEVEKGGTV